MADWDKARMLFEAGESLNTISSETGIDKGNISRRAKKEGWSKGSLQPYISDMVSAVERITTELQPQQQQFVSDKAGDILRLKGLRDSISEAALKRVRREIVTCDLKDVKPLIEAADKACVMAEVNPRFNPNSGTQISTTTNVALPVQIIVEGV